MAIATLDRIATDVRDPRARSYIPLHRARRALMEGRAEEAERLIDEGVKLAWSLHDSTVPILAGAQLFALRRAQGRLGELETAVHQFADSLPAMPAWRCALAVLYLDDGREVEARRELEHLAARGFADFPRDNVWMVSMASLAELCEGLERRRARRPRSNGCSRRSRRATSSRPRASSAARSRATSRCAPRRGPTGTSPARTWPPRGRRPSGCRSARRSRCSTSTRPRSSPARAGPGDAEAARALLVRARERSAAIGVPVMGGRLERVEEMLGADRRRRRDRVPGGDRSRAGRRGGRRPHREPAPRGRRVARRVRGPHPLRQGRQGPAPPRAAARQPGRRAPRGRHRRRGRGHDGRARRGRASRATPMSRSAAADGDAGAHARPAGEARVPHAPRGPARGDRGGRGLQRPRARRAGARGDGVHRRASSRAPSASAAATARPLERRARAGERRRARSRASSAASPPRTRASGASSRRRSTPATSAATSPIRAAR